MSQTLTNTIMLSNAEHPPHANPSISNDVEICSVIQPLQVQHQDAIYETSTVEIEPTGADVQRPLRNSRSNIIIIQLSATALLASISSGLINVCIPRMAIDLEIAPPLYFW